MKFFFLIIIFLLQGCNNTKVDKVTELNTIVINNILIKIPKSWKKDDKLKIWRENNTGATVNIETEISKLSLKDYTFEALKMVKNLYSYSKKGENKGKIGKYSYLDTIGVIEVKNRVMVVHSIIIDKDNLKITITMAVNKEKEDLINYDFNYILKSLILKKGEI